MERQNIPFFAVAMKTASRYTSNLELAIYSIHGKSLQLVYVVFKLKGKLKDCFFFDHAMICT